MIQILRKVARTGLIVMSLMGLLQSSAEAARVVRVQKPHRALLVVSNLTARGAEEYSALYEYLDAESVRQANAYLRNSYERRWVLAGDRATFDEFTRQIEAILRRDDVQSLDVMVHLHGFVNGLAFVDGAKNAANIENAFAQMRNRGTDTRKLRILYSTACWGRSLLDNWKRIGFQQANGANKVNAGSAQEYEPFLRHWRDGDGFEYAVKYGDTSRARSISDTAAELMGFRNVDSTMYVDGIEFLQGRSLVLSTRVQRE